MTLYLNAHRSGGFLLFLVCAIGPGDDIETFFAFADGKKKIGLVNGFLIGLKIELNNRIEQGFKE